MEFLKNNRLFDFIYGGKTFDECEFKVTQKQDGNTVTTVYDFADGLKVTNIAKKYENFGAYEWVNYFENTSSKPTVSFVSYALINCFIKSGTSAANGRSRLFVLMLGLR